MSYIRREESLESMAARAINEGLSFGENYAFFGPELSTYHKRMLQDTLARLACGEVFDVRDDECVCAMGAALVSAANNLQPGYGNRVLNVCTYEDFLISTELEDLRWFILCWQSFSLVRGQVRARMAARRLLAEVGDA
ncbi:hypothetical protein GGR95_003211 [Sulfitobacter undariae]|uniref:Uncharacterized protein n=1 Tax=Sulfitobacter undariae TaxID=1563671 RepID=A0A7W6H364_9RHOB|nr:hypothetical protein [Sulfitobacter undariae]MBB3995554.1 hypothetical protein [Sulfitobacter undariae]